MPDAMINSDSTSNEYGQYGSEYSDKNINNPYGVGNPYRSDSPANPYSEGLRFMVMMMAEAFPRKRRFV